MADFTIWKELPITSKYNNTNVPFCLCQSKPQSTDRTVLQAFILRHLSVRMLSVIVVVRSNSPNERPLRKNARWLCSFVLSSLHVKPSSTITRRIRGTVTGRSPPSLLYLININRLYYTDKKHNTLPQAAKQLSTEALRRVPPQFRVTGQGQMCRF